MDEVVYDIIFRGDLVPGKNVDEVKQKLANLYKKEIPQIEKLFFQGKTVIVKRDIDYETAIKLKTNLTKRTGAVFETRVNSQGDSPPIVEKTNEEGKRSDSINDILYNVIFYRELIEGHDLEIIKQNLSTFFNLPVTTIGSMFINNRLLLKENVDYARAKSFKEQFEKTGAICRIEVVEGSNSPTISKQLFPIELSHTEVKFPTITIAGSEDERNEECDEFSQKKDSSLKFTEDSSLSDEHTDESSMNEISQVQTQNLSNASFDLDEGGEQKFNNEKSFNPSNNSNQKGKKMLVIAVILLSLAAVLHTYREEIIRPLRESAYANYREEQKRSLNRLLASGGKMSVNRENERKLREIEERYEQNMKVLHGTIEYGGFLSGIAGAVFLLFGIVKILDRN